MPTSHIQISNIQSDKLIAKVLKAFRLKAYNSPTRSLFYMRRKMLLEEEMLSETCDDYVNEFDPVSQFILYNNSLEFSGDAYLNENYRKFITRHILTARLTISISPAINSHLNVSYIFYSSRGRANHINIIIDLGRNGNANNAVISFNNNDIDSELLIYLMQAGA